MSSPQSIDSLPFGPDTRVLVLAPHPDDFDAIGVTMKTLFDRDAHISVLVAMTGSGVEPDYRPGADLAEIAGLRRQEQLNSLRFFGLPEDAVVFQTLENDEIDQMAETESNYQRVLKTLGNTRPELVFLPHRNDSNAAHRAMYSMFRRAVEELDLSLTALLCRDPKTIDMRTDVVTPFDEQTARWKARLLRFHDSQHQRNLHTRGYGFDERILQVNRAIAQESNLDAPYAEAFELETT